MSIWSKALNACIPKKLEATLEARLEDHGYTHHCKLLRILPEPSARLSLSEYSDPIKSLLDKIERPLVSLTSALSRSVESVELTLFQAQHIDVLLSEIGRSRTDGNTHMLTYSLTEEQELYQQFINVIGSTTLLAGISSSRTNKYVIEPRPHREFVLNDERRSYLIRELIETEESYIKNMNVLSDMYRSECYSKFLQGVEDAQITNLREQKINPAYRAFLDRAKDHPDSKRQTLHDLLVQPGQRIGRYTMMFKEMLKYTSSEHPDYPGLSAALKRAEEIATMADDSNTRLAKTFFNMHRSIENCPASLINQNRSLLRHIDATELDIVSRKPLRPVTIFLFTDKIMVVRRPSYNVNGFELCGLVNGPEVIMRTRSSSTSGLESFLNKRSDKSKRSSMQEKRLKFKGWIGLEDTELLDGSADLFSSFMLQNTAKQTSGLKKPASPTVAANMVLENYFLEQPLRLYSTCPPQEEIPNLQSQISIFSEKKEEFCKQFHKAKAIFSKNERYHVEDKKNNTAILYIDDPNFDIQHCISSLKNLPPVLGIVQVVPEEGFRNYFRFSVRSRIPLDISRERNFSLKGRDPVANGDDTDFESIFWSNIIAYGWAAKRHNLFNLQRRLHAKLQKQDSRPRKAKSITTLSKIFNPTVHTGINPQYVAYLNAQSMSRTRPASTNGPIPHHSELEVTRSISTSSTVRSNNSVSSRGSAESSTGSEMSDDYAISESAVSPAGNRLLSMFKRTDEQPKQEMLFRVVTPSSSPMSQRTSSPFCEISALEAHIAQLRSSINRETETKRQYESQLDEIQSAAGNIDSTIRSISRNSMLSNSTWSSNHTGFSTLASGSSISSIDEEVLRKMDNEEYYASIGNEVTIAMENLRDEFEERWSALAKNCELLGNEVDGLAAQLKDVSKCTMLTTDLISVHHYLQNANLIYRLQKERQLAEIRGAYQDSTDENKILFETFNDELEQILSDSHSDEGLAVRRPSHPSPEIQIKRKLKNVLLDRNSWRRKASELSRELNQLREQYGLEEQTNISDVPIINADEVEAEVEAEDNVIFDEEQASLVQMLSELKAEAEL
ncbi:hypothetical protein NQZ79_g1170 [Umbelopsis isabellina]|nr:hypothetical protein NQZ79_g1170 [Umbelopsis isabellina]